jgi:hypothetical protein
MPIHFAAVGTNGSVVAGTFHLLPGGPSRIEGLTAPLNIMHVDSRGGAPW